MLTGLARGRAQHAQERRDADAAPVLVGRGSCARVDLPAQEPWLLVVHAETAVEPVVVGARERVPVRGWTHRVQLDSKVLPRPGAGDRDRARQAMPAPIRKHFPSLLIEAAPRGQVAGGVKRSDGQPVP